MNDYVKANMSYVYLLKHAELPLFKIGLSKAPLSRARSIGNEAFNLSSSSIVTTENERCARRLERVLHLIFDASRQRDSLLPQSGATEWFSTLVYEQALSFIRRECTAFGVKTIGAAVGEHKPTQTKQMYLQGEAWKARREQTESNKVAAIDRAYWLLWQFVNSAASTLAPLAIEAGLSDGYLWLFTCAQSSPFTRTIMDGPCPRAGISADIRRTRDVRKSEIQCITIIPWGLSFRNPREAFWVRLLKKQCTHHGRVGLLLADMKHSNEGERLYVKALATHLPAIKSVCGDYASSIESPREMGPTGDVFEWNVSIGN